MQIFSTSWLSSGDSNPLFPFLKEILGYKVRDTELYQKAFIHRSMNQKDEEGAVLSFERLEYLGDSILSTVVAKFLYEKLPYENEGELTRMKSKIVSREKLNAIGKELKLLESFDLFWQQTTFWRRYTRKYSGSPYWRLFCRQRLPTMREAYP